LALLYSGMTGDSWRDGSDNDVNDVALKFRMELTPTSQIYGKVSSYDVKSRTPGGLTVAEYEADPFQNTRPTDYWEGERQGVDLGYLNTISGTQEVEVRTYYNESSRASSLTNAARTELNYQPRDYEVFGLEPRYTQRFALGPSTHDVTVGYRYLRERGNDRSYLRTLATGVITTTRFDNATDAHAAYIDNRIAYGNWRITPGLRFEHIETERVKQGTSGKFVMDNNKGLPSLNVAYLFSPKLTGFASYGTSFGPVQNIQLNSMSANNPLTPEIAKTFEVGSRWQDQQLRAEITAFHMRFDNQILQVTGSNPAVFQNLGATEHKGVETALEYTFDGGVLDNLTLYTTYTYTEAIQESGVNAGNDLPFYSRHTDTLGLRYAIARWTLNLSSTHQSKQYSDAANTVEENADADEGLVPGFRVWNAQAGWDVPGLPEGSEIVVGANNLTDERYYTRNVDGNAGRMVGAPRTVYVQARVAF
jgi:Fe(3+) dicitrate transport protein